jgi:Domain of Unknown Function (DUF1080)
MSLPALVCLSLLCGTDPAPSTDLFDGKSLKGWVVEGAKEIKDGANTSPVWVAKNGVLSCMAPGGGGFLRYDKVFGDFHLSLEYRFEAPAGPKGKQGNSGVGIRTTKYDPKKSKDTRPSFAAYEVQLLDDADKKPNKHSTASLYRYVAPKAQAAKAAPAWNKIEIECVGPRITITLNGKKVLDVDQSTVAEIKDKPLKGYINLQNHGTRVDFRNIKLREIKAKE